MWSPLIDISNQIIEIFDKSLNRYAPSDYDIQQDGWLNLFWNSDKIRKCHLQIIDLRESKKIFLMHINIFPNEFSELPILGFDVVAGQNKITGLFFDFSPIVTNHYYMNYFIDNVGKNDIIKLRDIPDWGKPIFSDHIISAGNIRTENDLEIILKNCVDLIEFYMVNLEYEQVENVISYKEKHNIYCKQQKLNPHLHRSLLSMGLEEEVKTKYLNKILFEEI